VQEGKCSKKGNFLKFVEKEKSVCEVHDVDIMSKEREYRLVVEYCNEKSELKEFVIQT